MSKFFFNGHQDSKENHIAHGYETKGTPKPGSKKYPLQLTVTSEQRITEIEAILKEHGLYANISFNNNDEAQDGIPDLTAKLNKPKTIAVNKTPCRNAPCSCGSGKKDKKCCSA